MRRLRKDSGKNSPKEYDRIFKVRREQGVDSQDKRRWKKLLKFYKGGDLLDIGCLDSVIPAKIYPNRYFGIDLSEEVISRMEVYHPYAWFYVQDLYKMKFSKNRFNYIVMGEVLEHLEDPKKAIKEATRVLKPGGVLALSTPLEETELGEVDKERHLWSFSKQDMFDLLSPYGEVTVKRLGSEWFPRYKYHFPTIIAYCKKR